MSKVTVYRFRIYDANVGELITSRRMATRKGIAIAQGHILEDTATEIDESALEPGEEWTPRDFGLQNLSGSF